MRCVRCFLLTDSAHVTRNECIFALRAELVSRNLALALANERIRALEGQRHGGRMSPQPLSGGPPFRNTPDADPDSDGPGQPEADPGV